MNHRWLRFLICPVIALAVAAAVACGGDTGGDDSAGSGGNQLEEQRSGDVAAQRDGTTGIGAPSASEEQAPETSPGGGALPQLLDRKLIQTTTLNLQTDAVSEVFQDVTNVAVSAGGVVFSSTFGNDGDRQTASLTIRVPNERYQETLSSLRRFGEVTNEQSNTNEVTAEFTDLESRLRNLQATERQYLTLLERAASIPDILTVQDRVNATRAEIEQVQGRINLLQNQTDLATITVHLSAAVAVPAKDGGAGSPLEVAEEAFEASLATLRGIAVVVVAVAAYSWWLLPLAGIGVYLGRRQLRAERDRAQAGRPPPA